jgi:hypothetical protein
MRLQKRTYYVCWYLFEWLEVEFIPDPVDGIDDSIVCNYNCLSDIGHWYFLNADSYDDLHRCVPIGHLFFMPNTGYKK